MTIEPTEFDMIALARRGLQALLDEAVAEDQYAARHAWVDKRGELTAESQRAFETAAEAIRKATDELARFNVLYPEPASAPRQAPVRGAYDWGRAHGRIESSLP